MIKLKILKWRDDSSLFWQVQCSHQFLCKREAGGAVREKAIVMTEGKVRERARVGEAICFLAFNMEIVAM